MLVIIRRSNYTPPDYHTILHLPRFKVDSPNLSCFNRNMNTQILAIFLEEGNKLLTHFLGRRKSEEITPSSTTESPEEALARIYSTGPAVSPSGPKETLPPATVISPPTKESTPGQNVATACIPCAPPGTLVIANPRVEEIQNISIGDRVLDAGGQYSKVTDITKRYYDGELISISLPYQSDPIVLTPEHHVPAIKAHLCKKRSRICLPGLENPHCKDCDSKRSFHQILVPASQLSAPGIRNHSRHILLMPILKTTKDIKEINVAKIADTEYECIGDTIKPRKKNAHNRGRTARAIKNIVPVSQNFMALAGFYLAEGSVSVQARGMLVRFDYGYTEEKYASETVGFIKELFGVNASVTHAESTIRVSVSSTILGHFFENMFGKGAHDKHVPQWMLTLPPNKQVSLLTYYWKGDGSQWVNKGATQTCLSASTASASLACNLRLILHRLGIIHGIRKLKQGESNIKGRVIKSGFHYQIGVNGQSAVKLAKYLSLRVPSNWRFLQCHQAGIDKNWVYLPIRKIKRIKYQGTVLNLTTLPSNTYTVAGVAVHNCSVGHFGTSAGLLNEAVRFKKEGMVSNEILDRIAKVLEEQNALERVDLTPERLQATPGWEKPIAEEALTQSRNLRHRLEDVETIDELQKIAAETETYYKQLNSAWFRGKLGQKKSMENQVKEVVEAAEAVASEQKS